VKLCIDCKRFQKASGPLKHTGEYGQTVYFELPDLCLSMKLPHKVDPIDGGVTGAVFPAKMCREDVEKCGPKAKWFEPGTLDGRLAMLEPDEDETNAEESSTVRAFSSPIEDFPPNSPEQDMSKSEKLDAGNPGYAANCAQRSRTAKAGEFDGGKPPSGPKPEPVRLNGVPKVGGKGVSGK
jgi:hypothetical protein